MIFYLSETIMYIFLLIGFSVFIFLLIKKISQNMSVSNYKKINELSFQRYSKFLGKIVSHDNSFDQKISKIYELIVKSKETDIDKIAKLSNCDYNECILKIKYLKHKELLKDYYIDTISGTVKVCNNTDKALIKKYAPYIYHNHYQIDEIARNLSYASIDKLQEIQTQVLNELDYLDKKNLIHGLNIDKVDKKIIYYDIEKIKKEKDYISVNCESCGALNDVPRNGKTRCEYCERIIEDIAEK